MFPPVDEPGMSIHVTPQEKGFPGSAYGTSKTLMTQLHRVMAKEARFRKTGGDPPNSGKSHGFPCFPYEHPWTMTTFWWFWGHPKSEAPHLVKTLKCPGARLHLQHCFVLFVLGSVEQTWPRDAAPSWAARHFIGSLKVAIYWFPLKAHFV